MTGHAEGPPGDVLLRTADRHASADRGDDRGGIISLFWTAPEGRFDAPGTYFVLLAASVGLAASKVPLPLLPSSATLSLSYTSNFAALALLGPFEATLVVAAGAWCQCTLYSSGRIPPYRTIFSVANVVVSSQIAAWAARLVGGYDLDD